MKQPLVSVIVTSYNQPLLLKRALDSLAAQTYPNIEIVIVDDCSVDAGNKEIIEIFKRDHSGNVQAIYQKHNIGIPANKNTGFKLARGEYITYLDGDDTYYENKIASELATFLKNPDVDVVYSNFDIRDMEGNILSVWANNFIPAQGKIFKDILLGNFPDSHTHRCEMFKRHVLHTLGFYDEQFSVYHDMDFMLRYSLKYKVAYNNLIGSSYFKNAVSIVSQTKGFRLIEQQEQVYKKYSAVIKEQGLEKEFKKHLNNLLLTKQFYADHIDYHFLFKAFLKQPYQVVKIARIINYLYKTRSTGT